MHLEKKTPTFSTKLQKLRSAVEFFSAHFNLKPGYFVVLELTNIYAAHQMENKIKTGNSSMLCNKENKKKSIVIFSSAIKEIRVLILHLSN